MKRFKLISILSLFLLSSCSVLNNDMTLKVKYVQKGSTIEHEMGANIRYGESFYFDHFVLYKTSNGQTSKVESGYKVTFSGTEGLTEEMFKSNKPEIGEYNFTFEYKGKYTGMGFRVDKNSTLPTNITMSMEDWDFLGDKIKPTFTNYIPSQNAIITYWLIDAETDVTYGSIDLDNGQKVLLEPGKYKLEANITDEHYSGATVRCEFNVKKVDFRSDILEVYGNNFEYTFMIGCKSVKEYTFNNPRVRYKDTKADPDIVQDEFYLTWKDDSEAISTDEVTRHKVVLHTKYFNDYEFEVGVKVSKREVEKPGRIDVDDIFDGNIDSVKYDGNEHTAQVVDVGFYGQYEVNEELSTLKATEKGTYTVVVQLVDKVNLLWEDTHNNVDLVYTWRITD